MKYVLSAIGAALVTFCIGMFIYYLSGNEFVRGPVLGAAISGCIWLSAMVGALVGTLYLGSES